MTSLDDGGQPGAMAAEAACVIDDGGNARGAPEIVLAAATGAGLALPEHA
jgi:hypothetical protein